MASITMKIEGMDAFKQYLETASKEKQRQCEVLVANAALKMQEEAMKNLADNHSVKTGSLVKSIQVNADGLTAIVKTNIDYASYVEYGTDAHVIPVGSAGFLAFKVNDNWIYTKKDINHPGTKPKPFFGPAFETARNYFLNEFNNIVNG